MNSARPHIEFSEEQDMLLDVATKFTRDKSPVENVRKRIADEQNFPADLWREITELGWPAIAIDEKFGGSGLSLAEAVAISEPMGRTLFASPLASTWVAAEIIGKAASEAQQEKYLTRIAQGQQAALAFSEPDGNWALDQAQCTAQITGGPDHAFWNQNFHHRRAHRRYDGRLGAVGGAARPRYFGQRGARSNHV